MTATKPPPVSVGMASEASIIQELQEHSNYDGTITKGMSLEDDLGLDFTDLLNLSGVLHERLDMDEMIPERELEDVTTVKELILAVHRYC